MLDRIGEEEPAAVEPGLCDRLVEQAAGGADEGPALYILLIARLFAHQHDARRRRPLARHPLRRVAIERAAGAAVDRADKVVQRIERSGGVGHGMSVDRKNTRLKYSSLCSI